MLIRHRQVKHNGASIIPFPEPIFFFHTFLYSCTQQSRYAPPIIAPRLHKVTLLISILTNPACGMINPSVSRCDCTVREREFLTSANSPRHMLDCVADSGALTRDHTIYPLAHDLPVAPLSQTLHNPACTYNTNLAADDIARPFHAVLALGPRCRANILRRSWTGSGCC